MVPGTIVGMILGYATQRMAGEAAAAQ